MSFDKKKLQITPASFQDANELRRVIGEAIQKGGLNLGKDFNFDKVMDNEIGPDFLNGILTPIISVINSKEVENAILKCAERALYDKQKINIDFFEDVKNRHLYIPIMFEIAKENLSPFFGGLSSGLNTIRGKIGNFLKQK